MEKSGTATVVKHTGSHYMLSELPEWKPFPAVLKGKVRLQGSKATNPVAVGDKVEYIMVSDEEGQTACISGILPRRNGIIRKSTNLSRESHILAANIDKVFLVVTMVLPETKLEFVDRFLVSCEAYGVHPVILVNKTDLHDDEAIADMYSHFSEIYTGAGYQVTGISTFSGEGIEQVKEMCKDSICMFSGASGVGKSSLLKALDPSLNPKIGEISFSHLQGKHTTTFYEMHPLECGGFVIDTPGIRGFGLVDIAGEELGTYFPEMLKLSDDCRFKPCTHTHEPGCAVKKALEDGLIAPERYYSYLGMLQEETKYR